MIPSINNIIFLNSVNSPLVHLILYLPQCLDIKQPFSMLENQVMASTYLMSLCFSKLQPTFLYDCIGNISVKGWHFHASNMSTN